MSNIKVLLCCVISYLTDNNSLCLWLSQTAHRGPAAKQTSESQSDASNATSAPANASGPSAPKSKPSGKPDTSDGEDWGREQEEEEEDEEEDDEDDDADEDYAAPGGHAAPAAGSSQPAPFTEWTCPQCQTTFTDNDDYLSHVKLEHGKVAAPMHRSHRGCNDVNIEK